MQLDKHLRLISNLIVWTLISTLLFATIAVDEH